MKATIELNSGFELRLSIDGEYYNICHSRELIYSDSANEDMYNEYSAVSFAEDFLNQISENAKQTLVLALTDGYKYNNRISLDDNAIEAENWFIEHNVATMTYCELYNGQNQNYTYGDKTVSGEIFDFGKYDAEAAIYFRANEDGTFTPVSWYDIPNDEGRKNFVFVFAAIVYEGKVLKLYDRFE